MHGAFKKFQIVGCSVDARRMPAGHPRGTYFGASTEHSTVNHADGCWICIGYALDGLQWMGVGWLLDGCWIGVRYALDGFQIGAWIGDGWDSDRC